MSDELKDKVFCEIASELGFITQEQTEKALEAQKVDDAIGQKKRIASYLLDMNLISKDQISQVIKMQDKVESSQAKPVEQQQPNQQPPPEQPLNQAAGGALEKNMIDWTMEALKKYATFSGRARRKEYWYFVLSMAIVGFVLRFISAIAGMGSALGNIYNLAIFLPSLATGIRRMHDTDRCGWWILLPIVNIVFLAQDSHIGTNQYGPNPKGE